MSNNYKPSTSWENAHPDHQDCATHQTSDIDTAVRALIMQVPLQEKCRRKRESLPPLPPCNAMDESAPEPQLSMLSRILRALQAKYKEYKQSAFFPKDAVVVRCENRNDQF